MHRRIGIRATHGFLISGNNIVMLVAVFIVAHCAFLSQSLCIFKRYQLFAVFRICRKHAKLNAVHRLSDIAARRRGNMRIYSVLNGIFLSPVLSHKIKRSFNGFFNFGRRNALEFKNR